MSGALVPTVTPLLSVCWPPSPLWRGPRTWSLSRLRPGSDTSLKARKSMVSMGISRRPATSLFQSSQTPGGVANANMTVREVGGCLVKPGTPRPARAASSRHSIRTRSFAT